MHTSWTGAVCFRGMAFWTPVHSLFIISNQFWTKIPPSFFNSLPWPHFKVYTHQNPYIGRAMSWDANSFLNRWIPLLFPILYTSFCDRQRDGVTALISHPHSFEYHLLIGWHGPACLSSVAYLSLCWPLPRMLKVISSCQHGTFFSLSLLLCKHIFTIYYLQRQTCVFTLQQQAICCM